MVIEFSKCLWKEGIWRDKEKRHLWMLVKSFNLSAEVHLHSSSSLVGIHQIPQAHMSVFPCLFLLTPPWFWSHWSLSSLVRNFGMFSHSRFSLIPFFWNKPVTMARSLYFPVSFHSFLFLSPFIKCPLPSRWHINTRNVARRFGRHGRNVSPGFVCSNISTLQSLSYSNTQVLLNIKHKLGQAALFYQCQWLLL